MRDKDFLTACISKLGMTHKAELANLHRNKKINVIFRGVLNRVIFSEVSKVCHPQKRNNKMCHPQKTK